MAPIRKRYSRCAPERVPYSYFEFRVGAGTGTNFLSKYPHARIIYYRSIVSSTNEHEYELSECHLWLSSIRSAERLLVYRVEVRRTRYGHRAYFVMLSLTSILRSAMSVFPLPPLKFRTAGFPQYGFKVALLRRPSQKSPRLKFQPHSSRPLLVCHQHRNHRSLNR